MDSVRAEQMGFRLADQWVVHLAVYSVALSDQQLVEPKDVTTVLQMADLMVALTAMR